MSLRNRARSLQKKTGLSYQQALARLRALGERPATLRRQTGWPLDVCDRFLVDGHAPIAVVEARADDAPTAVVVDGRVDGKVRAVCETLLSASGARSVALVDVSGRVMVRLGNDREGDDDGDFVVQEPVKRRRSARHAMVAVTRALLTVRGRRYETSLGLVRLRARKAVEELERLLDAEESPMMPPGGGGGAGGIPNELRVVEPVPAERPKPKPTPIGRKRKR